MRKASILATLILLLTGASYSQNYIGMSKDFIIDQLYSSPDYGKIAMDYLDDYKIIKYESIDSKTKKVFFLDRDNNCSKFIVIHNDYNQLKKVKKDLNTKYDRKAKYTWIERGIVDCTWNLDKKQKFFALVVTQSNNQPLSMNLR
ncbi:MAG: hypothetical protein ISR55_04205 [Bacteroidetes bacterium]|nr:hypothetical protein [Bacteroidota bacterium]